MLPAASPDVGGVCRASDWLSAGHREVGVYGAGDQQERPVMESGVGEREQVVVHGQETKSTDAIGL